MRATAWVERRFPSGSEPGLLPAVLERLRGTPARLEERVAGVSDDRAAQRVSDRWSIAENVGHLVDIDALWRGRIDSLARRDAILAAADMSNRATSEGGYDAWSLRSILEDFRAARAGLVARIESLDSSVLAHSAYHARLDQDMNVVDLAVMLADHDDHHLVAIGRLV
jgi:uncharacterized damage-inducible protein DinB